MSIIIYAFGLTCFFSPYTRINSCVNLFIFEFDAFSLAAMLQYMLWICPTPDLHHSLSPKAHTWTVYIYTIKYIVHAVATAHAPQRENRKLTLAHLPPPTCLPTEKPLETLFLSLPVF